MGPPKTLRSLLLATLAVVALLGVAAALQVEALRWRVMVLWRVASGTISDLSLREAVRMVKPHSEYDLHDLVSETSPFAVIENPFAKASDAAVGAGIFRERCATCHDHAGGYDTPDFSKSEFRRGASDWALFRNITRGVPGTPMRAQQISERQTWQLIAYIRGLSAGHDSEEAGEYGGGFDPFSRMRDVSVDRLISARSTPADWLTYSGAYDGWRYSELERINRHNVHQLKIRWIFQPSPAAGPLKASPIVADGVMFMTTGTGDVSALNAETGSVLWTYRRPLADDLTLCCGRVNRGVAVKGDTVYVATLDAHLLALDARIGKLIWDVEIAPHREGYSGTGAPIAVSDKVIVGIAGGEFGAPGFVAAYNAETGRQVWRFHTVPQPGEKGHDTWDGDSWKHGGAPTWLTGSYDPTLGLIYWGVGNPSPDFSGVSRPGDNLYSNSVVALEEGTGQLRWAFQFTPHDEHDWDAAHVPILIDGMWNGSPRKLLVEANRNGFYYVLDRVTGDFLHARAFVRQNWTTGFDSAGRPHLSPNASISSTGTMTYPSVSGGTSWQPSSYSPQTGTAFIPTVDQGGAFLADVSSSGSNGQRLAGGFQNFSAGGWTSLQAVRADTGERVWEHRFAREGRDGPSRVCGAMSTAGGLVFGCDGSTLVVLDTTTGHQLLALNTGATIVAAPVAFETGNEEFITVAAGGVLITLGL
jgi:alcohol dehydrogenase (cytochrome c)